MSHPAVPSASYCWQDVGVYGDRSCEKLAAAIHCRNCPEFSRLGRTLFHREISPDFIREWSEHTAAAQSAGPDDSVAVVVFRLGDEWFALRTMVFEQISEDHPVHGVPFRSGGVFQGLVNVNGELLLCISLDALLGIGKAAVEPPAGGLRRRIAVIRKERERFAFALDEVLGIRRVTPAAGAEVPVTVALAPSAKTSACLSIEGRQVGLLDEARLFEFLTRSLAW